VLWLAQALNATRYRSVIGARPGEPLATRAAACGIPVVPLRPAGEFDLLAAWRLRSLLRRDDVAIVHAHTAHAVSLAALATVGTGVRVVVTRRVDFRLRHTAASRWKYARADALIAISRAVADVMAAGGIPRSRIAVIPSGIDLTRRVDRASDDVLGALGVPKGAPLVVQVAQLVPHKDPVTFVEAVAAARVRVPDIQALIVGDGPLRDAARAAIDRLGLVASTHLTGYRSDADALLAAADVVALSSREEGLGTVLLDALALGKPIAATTAGGIPEIVTADCGRLTPVGDARALGNAIGSLMLEVRTDPQRRAAYARAARARADTFSIVHTAERTAEVYERVVKGQTLDV
jgi:glycosyltransferase involved in cell wall biosynthesis